MFLIILGSFASNPLLFLLQDIFLILKPSYIPYLSNALARLHPRFRLSNERIRRIQLHLTEKRISQTTLVMQFVTIAVPLVALISVLIPFTIIGSKSSATISVTMAGGGAMASADIMQVLAANGVSLRYWDSTIGEAFPCRESHSDCSQVRARV